MNQEALWLLNDKYDGSESEAFFADLKRLESGEPLAYVIGWVPFLGCKIWLDSRPLIPRPETEFWVAKAIADIKALEVSKPRMLDLCAGSGCVGVAALKALPDATCDFVEIDEKHHATIRKNLLENGIDESRFNILAGSLFENASGTYDAILTNPPYIDPSLSGRIQESVIAHEPELALFGGENGMELVKEILAKTPGHLVPGGLLYVEHEPEQEDAIRELLPGIESVPDQYGVVRYSVFRN